MKIARYWALGRAEARLSNGRTLPITRWRWSDESQSEAQHQADAAARDLARRVETGGTRQHGYYLDQPPREEIVREIKDEAGQLVATLTRNSYGSLILNTRDLMFIDIDTPGETLWAKFVRNLKGLMGQREDDPTAALRKRLGRVAEAHPNYTIRVYETFAGFRCAITNQSIEPATRESDQLLSRFEADPLYTRLCQQQKCYRVRLTPKYWRCGADRPPCRFPWANAQQEQQYRKWQNEYERRCEAFATCRFLEQSGRNAMAPHLQLLIELHDHVTRVDDAHGSIMLA